MIGIMNNLQLLVFDNEKALDWNNEYPCCIKDLMIGTMKSIVYYENSKLIKL